MRAVANDFFEGVKGEKPLARVLLDDGHDNRKKHMEVSNGNIS